MENIILSLVVIALTALLYFVVHYFKVYSYWKKRGVPNPTPIPFFGNTFSINCGDEPMFNFYYKRYFEFPSHKISGYYDFERPVLVIRDPELINRVLTKDFTYFQDRGFPYDEKKEPLTANLFNMGGPRWKNVRMKATSCFTSQKRKLMFSMITDLISKLKDTVDTALIETNEIEIKDVLARFSTDVITESAFGIQANALQNSDAEFRKMGRSLLTPNSRIRPIFLQICPRIMQYFGVRFLSKEMNDFFVNFVTEAIEFRKLNKVNRNDFLNSMIELMEQQNAEKKNHVDEAGITNASIAAECWFFFFAGFEASALVVSSTLLELARHPEIQTKLRNEVDEVLKKYNGEITYDALQEMTYMDKVVYETIRLYPSLPFLIRNCSQKYKIPDTELVIDKGTCIIIPVVGLHRDPAYYKNPDEYNPENFSDSKKNSRHHCTYLPFGEGPRICIASRFGMMQIKTGLAALMKNYEFSPSSKTQPPLKLTPRLILVNCPEIWLKCSKRHKQTLL